jgi:hypothetical protein
MGYAGQKNKFLIDSETLVGHHLEESPHEDGLSQWSAANGVTASFAGQSVADRSSVNGSILLPHSSS